MTTVARRSRGIIGDRFFHATNLLWRLREKTIREMLGEFAPAHCLMTGREVGHRFVQVALIEKQVIHVLQGHIPIADGSA